MRRIDRGSLKPRIVRLAGLKRTGSTSELSLRLGISRRSVKRLVSEIRDDGLNISYNKFLGTYILIK
jgi:biotin operon repressor